jgi:hypothetical protein
MKMHGIYYHSVSFLSRETSPNKAYAARSVRLNSAYAELLLCRGRYTQLGIKSKRRD